MLTPQHLLTLFFALLMLAVQHPATYASTPPCNMPHAPIRKENSTNEVVDKALLKRGIELPDDNYLFVGLHPWGIFGPGIIIDLDENTVLFIPTNAQSAPVTTPLPAADSASLLQLLRSEEVQTLPSESGHFGLDGYSAVIYFSVDGHQRRLNHWQPCNEQVLAFKKLIGKYAPERDREIYSR
jgi:hypothetical protein